MTQLLESVHAEPDQPASQTHAPRSQRPWPEQPELQPEDAEQSGALYPKSQKQMPRLQTPRDEQSFGQVRCFWHASPKYPGLHAHFPSTQLPCPLQLLGHGVATSQPTPS